MAVITRAYSEVDGTTAEASSVNRVIDDLYTLQAGNINSANLGSSGVGAANIETSAVITAKIDNSAVTIGKLNFSTQDPKNTLNYSLAATVASNALTIALKDTSGTDASATSPITITFRNSTAATGTPVIRQVTAALSTVISSGSTAGHKSAILSPIHVYALDNAGTVELAWCSTRMWDEQYLQTTVAEGGAGAADTDSVLYSTTQRSNVAIRYLGTLFSNQATAGTWVSTMTRISLSAARQVLGGYSEIFISGANGHGSGSTKIRRLLTVRKSLGSAITYTTSADTSVLGSVFTINEAGLYTICYQDFLSSGICSIGLSANSTELTTSVVTILIATFLGRVVPTSAQPGVISLTMYLQAGDVIRPHTDGTPDATADQGVTFRITKIAG